MAKSILRAGKITGVVIVALIVVAGVLFSAGVLSVAQAACPPPETVASPESLPAEPVEALLARCESTYTQADTLLKSENFSEAKALFLSASENTSDSELAMRSLARAGRCEIRAGNLTAADQLFEKLKNDYSTQPELNENIYYFGHSYWNAGEFDKAKKAYQFVAANSSDVERAFNGQLKVMYCEMELGNGAGVLPHVDRALEVAEDIKTVMMLLQLKAECHIDLGQSEQTRAVRQQIELYSDKEYYPGVQLKLAYVCRKSGQYEEATEIYNKVLQSSADDTKKIDAHAGIAAIAISLGNDSDVTAAIESLCTNFAGHEKLGWAVFVLGEEYYIHALKTKKDNGEQTEVDFQKAIAIWDKNINQIADSEYQVMACYFTAIAYQYLKDYRKSAAYHLKVFTDFPESRFAPQALFLTGRNLEKSRRFARGSDTGTADLNSVAVPVEEKAAPVSTTRQAYKLLLEKYPESTGAAYARRWLNKRSSN